MLTARSLECHYGARKVLGIDQIDLGAGSVTALVGPNGSGKSTLFRILAFLERPTRGSLWLAGAVVHGRRARRAARRVVTLVEQYPLMFDTSVKANVLYPLRLRRVPDADRVALDALHQAGAAHLVDRAARSLSGGETHRVALARALAIRPQVLLLDEPMAAADREIIGALSTILRGVLDSGTAVCLASHRLEAAYRVATHVVALADGALSPVTPENLFRTVIPAGSGARTVQAGPLELLIVTDRSGPATIAIPPDDIIVSRNPFESSARNQFTGRVTRIADDHRGRVTLAVDVGTELIVRITPTSLHRLDISLGVTVVLSVKAMAVRVF